MSILRPSLMRLDRLRRSARLAVLVLAIFVLRIGMVAACVPSDLAETLGGTHQEQVAPSDATHDAPNAEHTEGHCLHCSCHHAVALPSPLVAPLTTSADFLSVPSLVRQVTAPSDLSLRPPIR